MSPTEPIAASAARPAAAMAAAVAAGGVVGAVARWAVGEGLDLQSATFPWATVLVNVLGALLIGLAASRLDRSSLGWAFAVTGVLGGFTTMSGFAVELNDLVDRERPGLAAAYLGVTLAGGAIAYLLGERAPR